MWYQEKMIDPQVTMGEMPIAEMPEDIKQNMNEARSIMAQSPRGAAALLRLCLQNLCKKLLEDRSTNINADIALLVEEGLSPRIQKAMDGIRVTGNEAVHPGELDLRDDTDTSVFMCKLLNKICYELMVRPKEEDDFYKKLPESKKEGIVARDKKAKTK